MFINKPKFKDLLKKKEVREGKEANLEKGDFLALDVYKRQVSALPVYGNTYFDFYNKKIKNLKTRCV